MRYTPLHARLPRYSIFPFVSNSSDEFDGIVFLEEYKRRVARGGWLKSKFGSARVPPRLFKLITDADITLSVLERWFKCGGIE